MASSTIEFNTNIKTYFSVYDAETDTYEDVSELISDKDLSDLATRIEDAINEALEFNNLDLADRYHLEFSGIEFSSEVALGELENDDDEDS